MTVHSVGVSNKGGGGVGVWGEGHSWEASASFLFVCFSAADEGRRSNVGHCYSRRFI